MVVIFTTEEIPALGRFVNSCYLKRGIEGSSQNTHAHGNSRTNLFSIVHVEPEQEPPGEESE
jgi:hypothetical protein